MARRRRPGARQMLRIFLLLAAISFTWSWLSHTASPRNALLSLLITAFFTWRVSRGGRISRMILIIGSGVAYAAAVLAIARFWDFSIMIVAILCAAQIALLVSPPVYGRTRRAPIRVRAEGWAQLVRRPPSWLLPWACSLACS